MVCTLNLFSAMTEVKKMYFYLKHRHFVFSECLYVYEVKMKDIKECAEFYCSLLNKKYIFTLENNIKFELIFLKSNFHHLLGLGKLTDISELNLKNNYADIVFKKILKGEISPQKISKSCFYHKIEKRVLYFDKITDMLNPDKCKIIIDFDKSLVSNGTNLKFTKYILYIHKNDDYIFFTLGEKNNGIYPETFFYESSKRYTDNQNLLDVLDISVVEKEKQIIKETADCGFFF